MRERERGIGEKKRKRLNYTLDAHIHTLICSHRLIAGKWERKIPMTFILIRGRIKVSKRKCSHTSRHLIESDSIIQVWYN